MEKSLFEIINGICGCKFAHIEYKAEEKLPKKLGMGVVTKRVVGEVQLNYDYQTAVNNRLQKQGGERTFNALSLPWGQWEVANKVITHKGERYLRFYTFKGGQMSTTYYVDGRPATDAEVATIKAYKATKSTASARQGAEGLVENQVCPKNVKFDGIEVLECGEWVYNKATRGVA